MSVNRNPSTFDAARASRERQARLAGVPLVDGGKNDQATRPVMSYRRPRNGNTNPKFMTDALLLERAQARQEQAEALAPPPLSWERPA